MQHGRKRKRGSQNASKRQIRKRVTLTRKKIVRPLDSLHHLLIEKWALLDTALRDLLTYYDRIQVLGDYWTAADVQRIAELRKLVK